MESAFSSLTPEDVELPEDWETLGEVLGGTPPQLGRESMCVDVPLENLIAPYRFPLAADEYGIRVSSPAIEPPPSDCV